MLINLGFKYFFINVFLQLLALNSQILSREESDDSVQICNEPENNEDNNDLWASRYKPQTYLDLLSDEVCFLLTF